MTSVIVDKVPFLISVCSMRKFAAAHCGKVILVSFGFFSWLVLKTIWVPPDTPSTVSWSSSKTTGRELTKSGIRRGRLSFGVVLGSSNVCVGSAKLSDIPSRIGYPSEIFKALRFCCTIASVCNVAREGSDVPCAEICLNSACLRSQVAEPPPWIGSRASCQIEVKGAQFWLELVLVPGSPPPQS